MSLVQAANSQYKYRVLENKRNVGYQVKEIGQIDIYITLG